MKKLLIVLSAIFVPLLLMAAAGDYTGTVSSVNFALPKDINGVAMHDESLGLPVFTEAVTLTSTGYSAVLTVPSTGNNVRRQFRKLLVRNPSSTRSVYLCFGGASSCSTAMMKVPSSTSIVLDGLYFGPMNTITTIWGALDAGGSVAPEVTIW